MRRTSLLSPVERTAIEAAGRKRHCVDRGYYDDPFIATFAADSTVSNSPLMNRGYWLRVHAFEAGLAVFAARVGAAGDAPTTGVQVVNVGAGFDTSALRLLRNNGLVWPYGAAMHRRMAANGGTPPSHMQPQRVAVVRYVELDSMEIVTLKRTTLARCDEATKLFSNIATRPDGGWEASPVGSAMRYIVAATDLTDGVAMQKTLSEVIDVSIPTFVMAECVLCYLPAAPATGLLRALVSPLATAGSPVAVMSYDTINPNDRFGSQMVKNLRDLGLSMPGLEEVPTLAAHEHRLRAAGCDQVISMTMRALHLRVHGDVMRALQKTEMIDDVDEWGLVHEHYALTVGSFGIPPLQIFQA